MTGGLLTAPACSVWGSAWGALAGAGVQENAECGMRSAELNGKVDSESRSCGRDGSDLA